jgi:hypothetical protein
MGVTGHFVDNQVKLHHILLNLILENSVWVNTSRVFGLVVDRTRYKGQGKYSLSVANWYTYYHYIDPVMVTDNAWNNNTMMKELDDIWSAYGFAVPLFTNTIMDDAKRLRWTWPFRLRLPLFSINWRMKTWKMKVSYMFEIGKKKIVEL